MAHILDEELYQAGMALGACPTVACHETHVYAEIRRRLDGLTHVTCRLDEFGNLHAAYEHPDSVREPFRLVAHMDHPGFVVREVNGVRELHFAGGVEEKYFVGQSIVFYHEGSTKALGRAVIKQTRFSPDNMVVEIEGTIPPTATFATWDLPKPRCTKELFLSPACDDLAEVAVMVALLRRLSLAGAHARVHALFTRAEEIGFAGAFASLRAAEPLTPMPTLSLEMSRARGFAEVGAGPIVRVGDRLSVFDATITHWLDTAFRDLQAAKPGTLYQRLLMGGGTCEASVFHRAGLPTGALCVALNNYHNMGPGTAIRSESISLRDWQGLADFLFYLATEAKTPREADSAVAERLARLEEKGLAALRSQRFNH